MGTANNFTNIYNLYVDESGYYYVGQNKYRFFLLSSIVVSPDQRELADKMFLKWRKKHLVNPYKCLHASDFFENRNEEAGYKKPELSISRNFNNSIKELMDIISYIDFKAAVFYVDIPKIRERLKIDNPPLKIKNQTKDEKIFYEKAKREYSQKIQKTIGDKRFVPLDMTLKKALEYHSKFLEPEESLNKVGYVNLESQKISDIRLISIFHSYKNINYSYGENLLGINLHTKGSLDSGIELADFITYISCQTLRFKYRLKIELDDLPNNRHKIIKDIRSEFRNFKIPLISVTFEPF